MSCPKGQNHAFHPITKDGLTLRQCSKCNQSHPDDMHSYYAIRKMQENAKYNQSGYIPEWKRLVIKYAQD